MSDTILIRGVAGFLTFELTRDLILFLSRLFNWRFNSIKKNIYKKPMHIFFPIPMLL